MSRKNALKRLGTRLTANQMARRQMRIMGRSTVAQMLSKAQANQGAAVAGILAVLRRGIFGRMKWLLFGR